MLVLGVYKDGKLQLAFGDQIPVRPHHERIASGIMELGSQKESPGVEGFREDKHLELCSDLEAALSKYCEWGG